MSKVFVYGTLCREGCSHHLIEHCQFIKEAKTHSRYQLYTRGWFPSMTIDESLAGGVYGEVYEVPDEYLPTLDRYEGAPNFFYRSSVELADGDTAIAYLMDDRSMSKRIPSGRWIDAETQ